MVVFLLVIALTAVFGWNQWNYRSENLKAGLPYLVVALESLAAAAYWSLR